MQALAPSRAIVRRLAGPPEVTVRLSCDPPLVVEWYRVLLDTVSVPPLPAPILLVQTGGKPVAYRARGSGTAGVSMPGLVTLLPKRVPSDVVLRGVGEGALVFFENERRVPGWVGRLAPGEPVTAVDELVLALVRQSLDAARSGAGDAGYLAAIGQLLLMQAQYVLSAPRSAARPSGTRSQLAIAHAASAYVRSHLDGDLGVEVLARRCGVGVTHFTATFRAVTGITPHRYVRRARIEHACALLRSTALGVGEIAAAVGYATQAHFSTAFRAERGVTPSEYRRQCRALGPVVHA